MSRRPLDRGLVVRVAGELADRDGFDSVTLTRVAKELGVRQPALYRHVDGYDDLVRSLGLLGRELIATRLIESAVGVSGRAAVAAVGRAWRRVAADHPGLYAATDRYPCAGDAELEQAVERVVHVLSQALTGFAIDDDQRMHAARSLRSAFHGFAHLELGDGHPLALDLDDSFEQLIDLLCAGLHSLESTVIADGR